MFTRANNTTAYIEARLRTGNKYYLALQNIFNSRNRFRVAKLRICTPITQPQSVDV